MSSTEQVRDTGPIISEADLEALDTSSVIDEALQATDRVNVIFLQIGTFISLAATIIMAVLITISVIWRYVFNSSIPVASEGPSYLLPWLIAGGAIVAQAQMAHVGVDYFHEKFRGKAYEIVSIAIWAFVALLMFYMVYLSIYMAGPMAAQSTPIMGWPMLGSFSAFIVMSLCLAIQAAARAYYFKKYGSPRQLEPGTETDSDPDTPNTQEVSNA